MPGLNGAGALGSGPFAPWLYADVDCTQPVLPTSAPVGTLVGHWANQRYSVHSVTGPIAPTELYYLDGATCSSIPVPDGTYNALSAEIPSSTFVDVTITE